MSKEISSTNINNNFDYHDKGNTNKYSVINNVNAPNAGTLQVYIDSKSGNKISESWANILIMQLKILSLISEKLLIGYWGSWSVYRDGVLKFDTSHIDAILFTHLIYCFFAPTSDGEIEHIDVNVEMISKFRGLKSSNPECKLMAAVGGSDEARSRAFSQMASNPSSREKFARNALKFLNRYGFDGLDIHWLYPESGDKENLVLLLQSIKLAFKSSNHILSIAVGPTKYRGDRVYDVPGIESNVDFINLMTYDLHQAYEGVTGSNSSLYAGPAANQEHNVDACVLYWRSEGAPNEKIIVGLPTYGKTFQLSDALRNGLNEPICKKILNFQIVFNSLLLISWEWNCWLIEFTRNS